MNSKLREKAFSVLMPYKAQGVHTNVVSYLILILFRNCIFAISKFVCFVWVSLVTRVKALIGTFFLHLSKRRILLALKTSVLLLLFLYHSFLEIFWDAFWFKGGNSSFCQELSRAEMEKCGFSAASSFYSSGMNKMDLLEN